MNYEKTEKEIYEKLWANLINKTPTNVSHYSTGIPTKEAKDFINFLKKEKLANKNILDVGCGNGRHNILYAKNKLNSYGIDFSKSAIKIAEKKAKLEKTKINYKIGSVFNLPYKNKFFGAITDFGCLHHLRKSEWKLYKRNIVNVIDDNGYFLLYCFSLDSTGNKRFCPKTKKRNWTLRKNKHYNHFFTKEEVANFFQKDFKILKTYKATSDEEGRPGLVFLVFYMQKK